MIPMGTIALLFPNQFSSCVSVSFCHSRVGVRVHRDLVTRVKVGGEAGQNLGHDGRKDHVPGGQE